MLPTPTTTRKDQVPCLPFIKKASPFTRMARVVAIPAYAGKQAGPLLAIAGIFIEATPISPG